MGRGLTAMVELCRAGRRELIDRFFRGDLSLEQVWTAAQGAKACIEEIATKGEAAMVEPGVAAARLEHGCEMCPSRTMGAMARVTDPEGEATMVRSWYCGPALEEHKGGVAPTCGCLVATETVRADGESGGGGVVRLNVLPACAALLKSKQCWQGKW